MSSYLARNKNSKKNQKIKKHHYGFFSNQNRWGKAEKIKKKKIVPMSSYPTQNREFQKIAKKFEKLKNTIMALFQAKISW